MASTHQTLRGRFAAKLLRDHVTKQFNTRLQRNDLQSELPKFPGLNQSDLKTSPDGSFQEPLGKVCIVGAGAAGVYMAWMLSYLGIEYDLFEASDRIGGRVYTHTFAEDSECAHNYVDVGAMRVPNIASNRVTLDILKYLNVPSDKYYIKNESAPYYFGRDPMTYKEAAAATDLLENAFGPILQKLDEDFNSAFHDLIVFGLDGCSTREWLRREQSLDFKEIQKLETFDTGTGLFDQSMTESILDYADFPSDNALWYRVEGGMIKLIEAMDAKLTTHATLNTTVRAFKMHNDDVDITFSTKQGKAETRTYSAVFNSTTLGALGRIELNGLGSEDQITAIRSLAYDSAAKIAIKFKTAWWIERGGMDKFGGISSTDLPIRVVAYPAWTDKDDPNKPTVLIASYTWHQDAARMGSLIDNSAKPSDSEALRLVLQNLATMFKSRDPKIDFEFLMEQVGEYYGYSWANDPYSSGAFALFGPGQFTNLYPALFSPLKGSDNNIYIIGEHASAHHAWLSGAFYSAATSLYGWLMGLGEEGQRMAQYLKYCGDLPFGGTINTGEIVPPAKVAEGISLKARKDGLEDQGSLPDEMDEQVVYWMAQLGKRVPTDDRLKPRV